MSNTQLSDVSKGSVVDFDPLIDQFRNISLSDVSVAEEGNDIRLGPNSDQGAGGNSLNVIDGTAEDDWLFGTEAGDSLIGHDGNDFLLGFDGDDLLDGGAGDDTLIGDAGNDTYIFGNGYGQDVISDLDYAAGNLDTVRMATGVGTGDITVSRDEVNLYLSLNGGLDKLTLSNWFVGDEYKIEQVVFDDGTIWDVATLFALSNATSPGQELVGTSAGDLLIGGAGGDTLSGLGGNDTLLGGGGNDTLNGGDGDDDLIGESGDDVLVGGTGDDTYYFNLGDGLDTVVDIEGSNRIIFSDGIQKGDISYALEAGGVRIFYSALDSVLLENVTSIDDAISSIHFANGDVIDFTQSTGNHAPGGDITLSGTASEGQTLTVVNALSDEDGLGAITYQWQSLLDGGEWTDIAGATGTSFILGQAHVGQQIRVVGRYIDGQGKTEIVDSVATGIVANINDDPTGEVTISGETSQGQMLTASNTLDDLDGIGTVSYQWRSSNDGGVTWENIAGATTNTFVLEQDHVGQLISVRATYTDGQGTSEFKDSVATTEIANINDVPTGSVTLSGTATQGQTLTVSNTLADVDGLGSISYQWYADGVAINNATANTFTLTQAEVGKAITVEATYVDGFGTPEAVLSAASDAVSNINDVPTGSVTITGTPTLGQTLTVTNTLADTDGLGQVSYQWYADGVVIDGATANTLLLTQEQVGKLITATASYTDGFGTPESVSSAATTIVNDPSANHAPTGVVMVIGTSAEGHLVTATNTLADVDGLGSISYQWYANGAVISGATASTFTLTSAQAGQSISVMASYTDALGNFESVFSIVALSSGVIGSHTTDASGNWTYYQTSADANGTYLQTWMASDGRTGESEQWTNGNTRSRVTNADGSWDETSYDASTGVTDFKTTDAQGNWTHYHTSTDANGTYLQTWTASDGRSGETERWANGNTRSKLTNADGSWNETSYDASTGITTYTEGGPAGNLIIENDDLQSALVANSGINVDSTDGSDGYVNTANDYSWLEGQGVNADQFGPSQSEGDSLGTQDTITIQGWSFSNTGQLDDIDFVSSGPNFAATDVQNLVQAMAAFAVPASGQSQYIAQENQSLQPVLAANLH